MKGYVDIEYTHECDQTTTDLHFVVEINYEATGGSSGCTYGPPESCSAPEPPDIDHLGYLLKSYKRTDARKESKGVVLEEWDGQDEEKAARYVEEFVKIMENDGKGGKLDDLVLEKCIEAAGESEPCYPD